MSNMSKDFEENGLEAGFCIEQLEFMWEFLAKYPHGHEIGEINGLEEALEGEEEEGD